MVGVKGQRRTPPFRGRSSTACFRLSAPDNRSATLTTTGRDPRISAPFKARTIENHTPQACQLFVDVLLRRAFGSVSAVEGLCQPGKCKGQVLWGTPCQSCSPVRTIRQNPLSVWSFEVGAQSLGLAPQKNGGLGPNTLCPMPLIIHPNLNHIAATAWNRGSQTHNGTVNLFGSAEFKTALKKQTL